MRTCKIVFITIAVLCTNVCFGQLVINEGSNKNYPTLLDEDGEYEDWIEIYNPNTFQVNLGGYFLSVNGTSTQWLIPTNEPFNTVIPPNSFKVFGATTI